MPDIRPTFGPYEVLEIVGKGGMATVYRGRRRETGQIVAIKVMEPKFASNPVLVKRSSRSTPPPPACATPTSSRFGTSPGRTGVLIWSWSSSTARTWAAASLRHGPLPESEAVPILLQVADGLHAAHQLQMIHRDVKTENVLLSKEGQAKLSDLGLIKDLNNGEPLTRTRTCLGTIAFVAPEQFEDAKRAGGPADIYGLGATLYHALTGGPAVPGERNLQILRKKIQNDFAPPSRHVPSLSPHVDAAICKALDACPEKRQASCREFMDSLVAPRHPIAAPAPEPAPSDSDRRRAFRFPADMAATCRPLQAGPNTWAAVIQDVSGTGVRLRLTRRFEPGAVLAVQVPHGEGGAATLYAKVVWVREAGPSKWSVGCVFKRELAIGELETLLGNKPMTVLIHPD